jgi:predicted small secreted protein
MYLSKYLLFATLILAACESKPKVLVEETATSTPSPIASTSGQTAPSGAMTNNDMHQVVALEVLQAERYTYLHVVENVDTFWVAASKNETAKKGNKYFYRGGLLKTNFQSQEFNRTFDKIYLVSSVIDASAHPGSGGDMAMPNNEGSTISTGEMPSVKDAIKLDALMKSKQNQAGKIVKVVGKTVKVNNGIMGKNWIHIQDGTKKDGKPCDLTITTSENIPMGINVAFEGKIVLNKDFGAGYKYEIIMEEGKSIK